MRICIQCVLLAENLQDEIFCTWILEGTYWKRRTKIPCSNISFSWHVFPLLCTTAKRSPSTLMIDPCNTFGVLKLHRIVLFDGRFGFFRNKTERIPALWHAYILMHMYQTSFDQKGTNLYTNEILKQYQMFHKASKTVRESQATHIVQHTLH
jgi:hypothetical protein